MCCVLFFLHFLPVILQFSCSVAPDKVCFFNRKVLIFFLFLHKNMCCGYLLEAPG